ncbi:hypothetical protein D6D05_05136 [Aureobasidium pullulans]|nr:hypothetical protein D6D05_05136 [Aureobasidium pullulans]
MITQGSGPLWKDPMLDNRLKERLGMIYDTYLIVMRQMQEVMVKIACLLDIARQDNTAVSQLEHLLITIPSQSIATQGTSQSSVHDLKRRLKFGLKSGQIQPLLEELGRYNSTIYQFTESSKRLEGQRSATPKSTFTTPIHHVRNCAEKLHRCLGGAWTCPLHTSQVIDLQLESRVSRPDVIDDDVEDRVVFSIAFLDDVQPDSRHCLEIHVLTEEIQTKNRATGKVNFVSSSPAPSVNLSALPTVHFQTVRRWMRQDKEEMSIGFHKAVSFCIGCFASPNVDLQDTTFRQMVVDQVIVPLKDELKLWSA